MGDAERGTTKRKVVSDISKPRDHTGLSERTSPSRNMDTWHRDFVKV